VGSLGPGRPGVTMGPPVQPPPLRCCPVGATGGQCLALEWRLFIFTWLTPDALPDGCTHIHTHTYGVRA